VQQIRLQVRRAMIALRRGRDRNRRQIHAGDLPSGPVQVAGFDAQPAADIERAADGRKPSVGERLEQFRRWL
jgi:hypothetical protein